VSDRSSLRLVVLGVLVASLLGTLLLRLFYLQLVAADQYVQAASDNRIRDVLTPAVRGLILDQQGRPLVSNRTSLVVSIDQTALTKLPKKNVDVVLARLAKALGTTPAEIAARLTICGRPGSARPPLCWNGSEYQPIPVAKDVSLDLALRIMEKRSDFPGVMAGLEAIRDYPSPEGVNAAHLLGYLGPVSDTELAAQSNGSRRGSTLLRTDLVGRAGLEAQYDDALRGIPGVKSLQIDRTGAVVGTASDTTPTPGNYLVTNIDAKLQKVVELQLADAIARARSQSDKTVGTFKGDSGSAVVLDVRNGHVLAMASWPTYDPKVWVGGISAKEFDALEAASAGIPLLSRATQGLFAPGSTYKVFSTAAEAKTGHDLRGTYDCPSEVKVGPQTFRNHESKGYGPISLQRAIEVSCNTVFYGIADVMWKNAGGLNVAVTAADPIATAAKGFGIGRKTGVDLPSEARGRVGGRAFKQALWDEYHTTWCANAKNGYKKLAKKDPVKAAYYRAIDAENCVAGYRWREGDALNAAIGQGDTVLTPLQLAAAYAAISNGGTIWQPQVARAVVSSSGKLVKQIKPKSMGRVPTSASTLAFLRTALEGVVTDGTAKGPFAGFPLAQIPVAAKSGSAEVSNTKAPTSWFASFAPANKPRYAVVMMVSQGGTGAKTSAPGVRKIYEALFGITGSTVDPTKSVLVGGAPSSTLPTVKADGTPALGTGATGATVTGAAATGAASTSPSGAVGQGALALPFLGLGLVLNKKRRRSRSVAGSRSAVGSRR